jgi:hypothetical protein
MIFAFGAAPRVRSYAQSIPDLNYQEFSAMASTATSDARPVIRRRGNPNWVKGQCVHRRRPELKRKLTLMLQAHLERHLPELLDELTRRAMATLQAELKMKDPEITGGEQA